MVIFRSYVSLPIYKVDVMLGLIEKIESIRCDDMKNDVMIYYQ